jgi:tRNA-(MS[2]IO[6]A)-hydroxylase (MiaE)-like
VAEVLGALSYGERVAHRRAEDSVALAPDDRTRRGQQHVADRERENASLISARLRELGSADMEEPFRPFFEAFFQRTEPSDWLEAQAFHYVGDALVRDLADALLPVLDPVSAEVVRRALSDRDDQESFALDEITRSLSEDPGAADRLAHYSRRVIGEALTQTRRALDQTDALRSLLGGEEGEKHLLLELLQRHRVRLDRMGIEPVDEPIE